MLDPETKRIIISSDVEFEEEGKHKIKQYIVENLELADFEINPDVQESTREESDDAEKKLIKRKNRRD